MGGGELKMKNEKSKKVAPALTRGAFFQFSFSRSNPNLLEEGHAYRRSQTLHPF
jgi:hypothetical protein